MRVLLCLLFAVGVAARHIDESKHVVKDLEKDLTLALDLKKWDIIASSGARDLEAGRSDESVTTETPAVNGKRQAVADAKEMVASDVAELKSAMSDIESHMENEALKEPSPRLRMEANKAVQKAAAIGAITGVATNLLGNLASGVERPLTQSMIGGAVAGGLSGALATSMNMEKRRIFGNNKKFKWEELGLATAVGSGIGGLTHAAGGVSTADFDTIGSRLGAGITGALVSQLLTDGSAMQIGDNKLSCSEIRAAFGGKSEVDEDEFQKATRLPLSQVRIIMSKIGYVSGKHSVVTADICPYLGMDKGGMVTLADLQKKLFYAKNQQNIARRFLHRADLLDGTEEEGGTAHPLEELLGDSATPKSDEKVTLNEFFTFLRKGRLDCRFAQQCILDKFSLSDHTAVDGDKPLISEEDADKLIQHARSILRSKGYDFRQARTDMFNKAKVEASKLAASRAQFNQWEASWMTNNPDHGISVEELYKFISGTPSPFVKLKPFVSLDAFKLLASGDEDVAKKLFTAVDIHPSDPVTEAKDELNKSEELSAFTGALSLDDVKDMLAKAGYSDVETSELNTLWRRYREKLEYDIYHHRNAHEMAVKSQGFGIVA